MNVLVVANEIILQQNLQLFKCANWLPSGDVNFSVGQSSESREQKQFTLTNKSVWNPWVAQRSCSQNNHETKSTKNKTKAEKEKFELKKWEKRRRKKNRNKTERRLAFKKERIDM